MPRQIAFLRGVNVGGHKKVEMARLRAVLERLGQTDVRTYVQSGNVVFGGPTRSEAQLERAIEGEFGFPVPVVLRTRDELAAVVRANPLRAIATDPAKHIVVFCGAKAVVGLDPGAFEPEQFVVRGREVHFWAPAGLARSELAKVLAAKPLGKKSTARNWRTVEKLLALADDM
jgi:uncharacterized protein (DUF1697 family)